MSANLEQRMASAESMLAALQSANESATGIALQFGLDIGDIGRELTQHPELAPSVRAFADRTAPLVARGTGMVFWINLVSDAAESRSSETYEYTGALRLRSALEFFRDFYRDSVASHFVAGIETDETDENLKQWGAEQYLEEIPSGYPDSHVWWHQSLSGK